MSVLFIANGSRHAVIGYNRLLVTDGGPEQPFLYGGALGQAELDPAGRAEVEGWCQALVGRLGLRGINGLDFILYRGCPLFLELNARPSASLSLYEWQCAEGWICRHVRACLGELPEPAMVPRGRVWGQRIVYAPHDVTVPPDLDWPDWCRDRPTGGTSIPGGAPLCSVLADAAEPVCVEVRLAERVICILGLLEHGQIDTDLRLAGKPTSVAGRTGAHPEASA
jgi:predicted ATP-grasp superfamily ATP-dependent carboligase